MKYNSLATLLLLGASAASLFTSCNDGKKNEPLPPDGPMKKTILLYAVASNNLYGNLINDKSEILEAAADIDLNKYSILVYQVVPVVPTTAYNIPWMAKDPNNTITKKDDKGNFWIQESNVPRLLEVYRDGSGEVAYREVKTYDRSLYSTDPERISQVMNDVKKLRESESYGLILWSHALGWSPFFSNRDAHPDTSTRSGETSVDDVIMPTSQKDTPLQYSFGSDTNANTGYTDKIDIDELADAIPDGMFEFIWTDACMMSGIEVIYEFRDKCDYFGAYPTEVYSPGMPYHLTMPYLLQDKADMAGAGKAFFDYYAYNPYGYLRTATVAVVDMSQLEPMADFCKRAYANTETPSMTGIDYYSGNQAVAYPFYDFGQYTKARMDESEEGISKTEFNRLLDNMIVYKAATEKEFTGKYLNLDEYSGISCHALKSTQSGKAIDFYKRLDWYKRVY